MRMRGLVLLAAAAACDAPLFRDAEAIARSGEGACSHMRVE